MHEVIITLAYVRSLLYITLVYFNGDGVGNAWGCKSCFEGNKGSPGTWNQLLSCKETLMDKHDLVV